jgi:hypothetical protein
MHQKNAGVPGNADLKGFRRQNRDSIPVASTSLSKSYLLEDGERLLQM